MPFKIVRNDIVKMETEAIVNTANSKVFVGPGCDNAIYSAAGYEQLLQYRKEKIGEVPEGEVFITPGYHLKAKYIIHAVSPLFVNGDVKEEEKLRSCYRKSLALAEKNHIKSISFPLIATGGFGYPKEEGMRIALDEISNFLLRYDMEVFLVVFDKKATALGEKLYPSLQTYIDENYALQRKLEERTRLISRLSHSNARSNREIEEGEGERFAPTNDASFSFSGIEPKTFHKKASIFRVEKEENPAPTIKSEEDSFDFDGLKRKLDERKSHLAVSFSEYLLYLIKQHGMTNVEVYKRAIVDKKLFAKIKNDPSYHPQKLTCLCLCVGAKLSMDETKDLLARAGYALSPADMRDVIFSFFIENKIYDMIELDIQLEEHGIACIIA